QNLSADKLFSALVENRAAQEPADPGFDDGFQAASTSVNGEDVLSGSSKKKNPRSPALSVLSLNNTTQSSIYTSLIAKASGFPS
ncbi:hypothetical protein PoB_001088800, partial [Plakobranchus ocellatus]